MKKTTTTKTKATPKAAKTTTSKAANSTTKATLRATLPANAPKAAKPAAEPKTSRKDAIIALISRPNGATLAEIMKATEWQKHSVRGVISILGRTLKIASSENDAGERTYSAEQPKDPKPKATKPAPATAVPGEAKT